MIVDLGCGYNKQGDIGIDISPLSSADIICNLGFEPIPLEDSSVDTAKAGHFIEHVPMHVHYKEDGEWKRHNPIVFLFNEVYRILKPGGTFEIRVPKWDCQEMYQDPTHVSVWTPNSFQYFHEDCFGGIPKLYGVTSRFKTIECKIGNVGFELFVVLQKE
jgi:predicted SAM-dependent methyltransferase